MFTRMSHHGFLMAHSCEHITDFILLLIQYVTPEPSALCLSNNTPLSMHFEFPKVEHIDSPISGMEMDINWSRKWFLVSRRLHISVNNSAILLQSNISLMTFMQNASKS